MPIEIPDDDPTLSSITIILGVLAVIAGGVLIVGGIGLLKLRPWGRTLSIGYAIYALLSVVVGLAVNYVFLLQPVLDQAGQNAAPEVQGIAAFMVLTTVASSCFGAIYPVLLLIFMNRPAVVAAYSPKPAEDPFYS